MPTFDFQCTKCNLVFEFNRRFGSSEVPACPECDSKETEKLISPPTIHFKGSGFYKTDEASSKSTKKADESQKEEKVETSKKEEKAEKSTPKEDKKSEGSASAPNGATADKAH